MTRILIVFLGLATFVGFAHAGQNETNRRAVYGVGKASGLCDYDGFGKCKNKLWTKAYVQGERQAEKQCWRWDGDLGNGYCRVSCDPAAVEEDTISNFVTCTSKCSFTCNEYPW